MVQYQNSTATKLQIPKPYVLSEPHVTLLPTSKQITDMNRMHMLPENVSIYMKNLHYSKLRNVRRETASKTYTQKTEFGDMFIEDVHGKIKHNH